jgi:two-component system phosphate regulon sensor histidine kinase PhoR
MTAVSIYATIVDSLPDPIIVVTGSEADDLTGRRIVVANAAARELLRIDGGETLLVAAIRDPDVLDAADSALFNGAMAEAVYETSGAQSLSLRVRARPLAPRDPEGARMALLTFHDETEMRRVERTRVDFLANASHELRTPLASLTGFIETLRGHARDDGAARERFLGIMHTQAHRMARLIEDLMSLSRIELNEHIAPRGVVDLATLVAEVVEGATPIAGQRRVRLDWTPDKGEPILVRGDRDQIVQVVQNLLDNAIKYSPDGEAVRIVLCGGVAADAAAGGKDEMPRLHLLAPDAAGEIYAALRIVDQGPGIARQNLPRLSERFYRVEGQKSGDRPGTGLGLAIVKHIINRHRGGLVVASAEGHGSAFTVYLPLAAETGVVAKAS